MFYIKATFQGDTSNTRYIGEAPDLERAIRYMDNAGTTFSEGHPPSGVRIEIHNEDESIVVQQEFYNGYITGVQAIGIGV